MASDRRRGGESSAVRTALIEAAEQLIREEGYPAVTSRTLADKLGLKRQIVHYYFTSMDDVFIAVVRRGREELQARVEATMAAEEPLRALWELNSDPAQATLAFEMNALAHRRPALRAEIALAAEDLRALQCRVLARHLEQRGITPSLPPIVATVLLSSLSQVLTAETAIDVSGGHAETIAFVDACLRAFAQGLPSPMPSAS